MALSVAISAGEASGDLNGSYLATALRSRLGDVDIWGAGGGRMREAGVDVAVDMTGGGTIGISETLKILPRIAGKYFLLRSELLKRKPDVFVPIDFGAYNIRLAQIAHRNGIRVVYYFPPSSWRRRMPRNIPKLLASGGRVITPFPWSQELLCSGGVDARFVGHPLVDIVKPTQTRDEFLREFELSDSLPTIGLLPGSRGHEVREHIPPMLECAYNMHKKLGGAQFVIGAANRVESMRRQVGVMAKERSDFPTVRVIERRTYDCMAHSDFLIAASGTATLEAAILGTPMVIVYRGTAIMRFEYELRKGALEEFIGMPNIVADRGVCPEMLNNDVTPEKLTDIALSLFQDKQGLDKMRESLGEVKRLLGESGAVDRIADTVIEMGGLK